MKQKNDIVMNVTNKESKELEKEMEQEEQYWGKTMIVPIHVFGIRYLKYNTTLKELQTKPLPRLRMILNDSESILSLTKGGRKVFWKQILYGEDGATFNFEKVKMCGPRRIRALFILISIFFNACFLF